LTEEQAQQVPEITEMIANPPEWLEEWSRQIGAELKDGMRENPSWIAFAQENGTVYHTYTVSAPDPFVAPYFSFLLERTPKAQPEEPRSWRKDEYPGLIPIASASHAEPNQVVSASGNPVSVPSPTQATCPSGRISTAVGAVTAPSTGSSQTPA
jgi:hypothetical protein